MAKVTLNHKGIEAALKGHAMQAAVKLAADGIAANVEAQNIRVGDHDGGKHEIPLPVTVTMVTSDRAKALVTLAHPAGESVQAKHGALTKAAAQAGFPVKSK